MAVPVGWKKEGGGFYSTPISSGTKDVNTKLVSNLDGKQQIIDRDTNKVIYERNLGDDKWTTKDNGLAKKIPNAARLQKSATSQTYRLIDNAGTDNQKTAANNSKTFQSLSNRDLDLTPLKQDAFNPEPTVASGFSGRLQYPLIMTDQQDKIRFTACEIVPGSKATYVKKDDSIYIATQSPIQDTNTVKWGESQMNAIEQGAMNLARDLVDGGNPGDTMQQAMKAMAESGQAFSAEIKEYMFGAAAGRPDAFTRTTKKILNPNLELLFQGPQLRSFQMQFKMSPRDESEAKVVKSIIKYFKRHMAVRKDSTGVFLKSPHVFTVQYLNGSEIHKSIGKISPKISGETKACALLSCNVDYTPLGSYATYDDSEATMVAYNLNLQFQEIEPIYDTDYFEDDHSIGY